MSPPQYIGARAMAARVSLPELIAVLRDAILAGERAETEVPPRQLILREAPFAVFGAMPAFSARRGLFVTKVAASVEGHGLTARMLAMSARTGVLLATLDGHALTEWKSAAVSGVVLAQCGPARPSVAALIGSGAQARAVARAIAAICPPKELRVYSRDPGNVAQFMAFAAPLFPATRILAVPDSDAACAQAEIVITATPSRVPVCSAKLLGDATHIHCMGAHSRHSREVPHETLAAATVIVEDVATAVAEAGDVHRGALDLEAMLQASDLAGQRTVFSSTGHGFLDMITTAYILGKCAQ
jgi:ornithine cyclodeaminase/alanine dehydrogenase-like protein (mu-crystallin family)